MKNNLPMYSRYLFPSNSTYDRYLAALHNCSLTVNGFYVHRLAALVSLGPTPALWQRRVPLPGTRGSRFSELAYTLPRGL
jgi:hypothetical protein